MWKFYPIMDVWKPELVREKCAVPNKFGRPENGNLSQSCKSYNPAPLIQGDKGGKGGVLIHDNKKSS